MSESFLEVGKAERVVAGALGVLTNVRNARHGPVVGAAFESFHRGAGIAVGARETQRAILAGEE